MTFFAQEVYEYQPHIAGPWCVEDDSGGIVNEGLSEYQAHTVALALTIAAEAGKPDYEGSTLAELTNDLYSHVWGEDL